MNYENAKYIKMIVDKINGIEKKTKKPLDQPFDEYVQLVSLAFDGFKNDTACKWEYKVYTDRAKKKCFEMATKRNHMSDKWRAFYYEILQIETFEFFESFLYAMEIKRPFAKKFYEPREKTLKVVVQDLQDLEDGKYQFYGLSLPSRVGKSTICLFFLAWIVMRHPLAHSAMAGHSGVLADQFYQKLLGLFTSEDYTFNELYGYWHPDGKGLVYKNSEKNIIAFENNDDFPSIVCRGIDGTWTGAVDVSSDGYLYVDDLVRDREHSLSPQRMQNTFSEYLNKCEDRKNDGAKELMVGTLWNVMDPLMRLEEMYGDDERYRFRRIPALNYDTDESNFEYEVKGFSTQYYRDMREKMVKAGNEPEWWAKFQQKPYNREGLLFPLNELGYFNGILPEGHKFEFVICCDVAFGGGDYVSMPIGLKDLATGIVYVVDWYYNSAGVQSTVPGVADMIMKHDIVSVTFERDNGGLLFAGQVNEELQKRGYMCACETKPASRHNSKQERIKAYEGKIKQMVKFLDGTKHTPEERSVKTCYEKTAAYDKALNNMSTFVTIGKNENDDAPDSIAQMCAKAFGNINTMATVEALDRSLLGI